MRTMIRAAAIIAVFMVVTITSCTNQESSHLRSAGVPPTPESTLKPIVSAKTVPSNSTAPSPKPADLSETNSDVPPLFDRVRRVVEKYGSRTKCNDLNGCPMVNTLVSMGADAAPAIAKVYGRTRGDDHWRLRLLESLGRMRHAQIPPFLLQVARSDNLQPMRVQALISLGKQGDPQLMTAIRGLKSRFHPEKHRAELLAIGFAIAALGDRKEGVDLIRKHFVVPAVPLQYRRWDLLRPGVYAIGQLRVGEFRLQLEDISERADPFVRREAVEALAALRDRQAIPAIVARLNDEVPGIRKAAVRSLQTLTGLYNKKVPQQWRRWWKDEVKKGTRGRIHQGLSSVPTRRRNANGANGPPSDGQNEGKPNRD